MLKSLFLTLFYVIVFTITFLIESTISLGTAGFYIVFMPDKLLFCNQLSRWYTTKWLKLQHPDKSKEIDLIVEKVFNKKD